MSWCNINSAWYRAQEQHADRDGNSCSVVSKYTVSPAIRLHTHSKLKKKLLNNCWITRIMKVPRFHQQYSLSEKSLSLWKKHLHITVILHLEVKVSNIIHKTAQPNIVTVNTNNYLHFDSRVTIPLSTFTVKNMAKWRKQQQQKPMVKKLTTRAKMV